MADKSTQEYWVGFDLGATKMLAAVYDGKFQPIGQKRRKTKGHEGTKAGLDRMEGTIVEALSEAGVDPKQLSGIGVGAPGPLDIKTGTIPDTPNMAWKDARIKERLEKAFGCPVVLANDVDTGVYGEYRFGAGRGSRCVVGVFPGTGIGGGCVYEGKILSGKRLSCMEIGHLPLMPEGPLCGCGQRGCLEALASRLVISSAAAAAAYRGSAPHLMELSGTDLSHIRSSALAAAIAAGDKEIERIVREAARWLGVALAGVINLLLPEVVVLGGGLVEEMPELYRDEVRRTARERVMCAFRDTFDVKIAELGDDATVQGAAAWAREVIGAPGTSA